VSWNAGAQRIKGYHSTEIIGRHFSCFYANEDLQNGKPEMELQVAARDGRFEDEGWRIRKDGSLFWASVVITAVRDDAGKLIGFGKVTRDFTERMQAQQALEQEIAERREIQRKLYDSENSLRQLSRQLLRTQDEERRRIGRELHDSLGQSLAAMKIDLDSLRSSVEPGGVAGHKVAECIDLVQTAIKEVRTISCLLYPPMLEEMGLKWPSRSRFGAGALPRSARKPDEHPPAFWKPDCPHPPGHERRDGRSGNQGSRKRNCTQIS
jgi:PAS domain S-box-containing protein